MVQPYQQIVRLGSRASLTTNSKMGTLLVGLLETYFLPCVQHQLFKYILSLCIKLSKLKVSVPILLCFPIHFAACEPLHLSSYFFPVNHSSSPCFLESFNYLWIDKQTYRECASHIPLLVIFGNK